SLTVMPQVDASVEAMVEEIRAQNGLPGGDDAAAEAAALKEAASEQRLVKDEYEIRQMREAVDATLRGFEDVIRHLPEAVGHPRGERVIEGVFAATAGADGNGVGYDTIAAAGDHACTLHWTRNNGVVRADELVLIDAGVAIDSLYTADVTRTLPVSGKFSPAQRKVYDAEPTGTGSGGPCPAPPRSPSPPRASGTAAGCRTAPATTWAWTCTTAPRRAARCTSTPSWSRGWSSPSSPGCTSRRTICSPPRS